MQTDSGHTLMELAIAIVVLAILGYVASGMINLGSRAYLDSAARSDLTLEANVLLESFSAEIPAAIPGKIKKAKPDQFKFETNEGDLITYKFDDNKREMSVKKNSKKTILSGNVQSADFSYKKEDETEWNNGEPKAEIKRISIDLILMVSDRSEEFNFNFFIRNE